MQHLNHDEEPLDVINSRDFNLQDFVCVGRAHSLCLHVGQDQNAADPDETIAQKIRAPIAPGDFVEYLRKLTQQPEDRVALNSRKLFGNKKKLRTCNLFSKQHLSEVAEC